ncbi:protein of unknown function DUF21 [Thalassoporum mexicanum PCC 7367]|uniref:hemolysin family protein n=1 Tax=Thalassoporum mexicanum TaxID=3457544 RepID=UPI00029FF752|nr:hemolysin family protein [Pseudanabaena sp. PCC 7367]AFY71101.1 protein of unknown function DUF21 [Pseudanabaena sp. PCC 7367]
MDDIPPPSATLAHAEVVAGSGIVPYLLMILVLVAINAFFVAAEYAIVAVRRSRMHQLVESGSLPALVVQRLQRQIDRFLSTTQLGITLSSVGLGWLGRDVVAAVINDGLRMLPGLDRFPGMPAEITESWALAIAFLLIVYLQIVLGELVPKSIALMNAEKIALWLGKPSEIIAQVFSPCLWLLNQSTRLLLKLVGIEYSSKFWYSAVSAEELQMIITSNESSGLEDEERELLKNVFEFGEATAGEIMVPRTSIECINYEDTVRDLLNAVNSSNHSAYPVAGESLDDIRGVVQIKEVVGKLGNGSLDLDQSIQPYIRPVRFVSEDTYLDELLPQLQRSHKSMVMVVDEFGGTAGLVTLEDILEEIAGDAGETTTDAEPGIRSIDEQTFLIQAQVSVEEVNESLDLDLPMIDEYQTIGGFVIYHLQKIPDQGEKMTYGSIEVTITAADGPRIDCLRLHKLDQSGDAADLEIT